MNKLHGHGGLGKQSSVNPLLGQQPQQHPAAPSSISHMGRCLLWFKSCSRTTWSDFWSQNHWRRESRLCLFLVELWSYLRWSPSPLFLPGSNMLNSHHMQANSELNGGHSSQSIVSASHCSPPPPYNPDPSLVRYLTLQWHLFLTLLLRDALVMFNMNGCQPA